MDTRSAASACRQHVLSETFLHLPPHMSAPDTYIRHAEGGTATEGLIYMLTCSASACVPCQRSRIAASMRFADMHVLE